VRILVSMRLSDRNLQYHLAPLSAVPEVDRITVVRETPGPAMPKVAYRSPPAWMRRLPVLAYLARFALLCDTALRERPEIVHSYLLLPHGLIAYAAGRLAGARTSVSLIAGPVEVFLLGGSVDGRFSYADPLPPLTASARLLLALLRRFDRITVTGSYTRQFLVDHGVPAGKITVLPHITDEAFVPRPVPKDLDLVFVGRLVPVKHVAVLLHALARLRGTRPGLRAAIVGDGPERGRLEALARELGLEDVCTFAGFQPDPWRWYARSRGSVITSEREGIPYSAVESLRCGAPVITSACGDICDLVRDGENGFVVRDYRDPVAFAAAADRLLADPAGHVALAARALASAAPLTPEGVMPIWRGIVVGGMP